MADAARTLCFTDVVDSTRLAAQLGDARNAALWDAHDALARALVAEWRGVELERTDGIVVLFDDPADGLGFALAYHAALRTLDPPLLARAGLHTGPLAVRPNPPEHVARGAKRLEVDGLGVAVTARVMSVAAGGQTLLTARPETPLRTASHGHWRLKGVPEPVELFEVGDDLAPFRPPPDGEKAWRVVRAEDGWRPAREVPHQLPRRPEGFVGRGDDLRALADRLDAGAPVVTVTGPPGGGKSALVASYAWSWLGDWPGGAWWCDLAAARSLDDVRAAVEAVAGPALGAGARCLVVLDRCDDVAPHLPEALAALRDRAPAAAFVLTGRVALDLPGEEVLALPPLARADAVALFLARAQAAHREFRPADADPATVAALVDVLGRWPLPVALAAARVRTATPEALLAQLGADSRVLTLVFTEVAGAPALQRALGDRAAAARLAEREALRRATLAAFPDGEALASGPERSLAVFSRPSEAVRYALALRRALAADTAAPPVPERMALHLGEVLVSSRADLRRADGSAVRQVSGSPVDLGERLVAWAEPGRLLASRAVFDAARLHLGGDGAGALRWWAHGPYLLRDVPDPVDVCEVGEPGGPDPAPPPDDALGRRHDPAAQVVTGWRPAVDGEIPGTRYRLVRELGEGAVGEVWLARHATLKDQKVFKFCFQADRVRSLRREVTLFRVLRDRVGQHPNIAGVSEVSLDQPPFYLVVDFVDGPDLARWLTPETPLAERLEVVAQVADALQAAHEAGVVHRDVKPQNVLVGREGAAVRARLADFGIGQVLSEDVLGDVTRMGFTQTMLSGPDGSMSGTRLYLAPELLRGAPASPRSDLYALGVVLYQVLAGDVRRPLPVDWAADVTDPLLREDLAACFAGDPEKRWVATGQLARQLRTLPERRAERARREAEAALRERRALQRGVAGTGLGALAVLALVAGLGGRAWQQQQRAEDQERRTAAALAENRARLYQQSVAEGVRLEDAGDPAGALPYYAQALALAEAGAAPDADPDAGPDAHRVALARTRLAATLARVPRLEHLFATEGAPGTVAFSADGERVALGSVRGGPPVATLRDLDGRELARHEGHGSARVSPDPDGGFVSLQDDRVVALDAGLAERGPSGPIAGGAGGANPLGIRVWADRVDVPWNGVHPNLWFDRATLAPVAPAVPLGPEEQLEGLDARGTVAVARGAGLRVFAVDGSWSRAMSARAVVSLSGDGRRALVLDGGQLELQDARSGDRLGAPVHATLATWSPTGCLVLARSATGVRPIDPETGAAAGPWLPDWSGSAAVDRGCARILTADGAAASWRLAGPRAGATLEVAGRTLGSDFPPAPDRLLYTDAQGYQLTDLAGNPIGPLREGTYGVATHDGCCVVSVSPPGRGTPTFDLVRVSDGATIAAGLPGIPTQPAVGDHLLWVLDPANGDAVWDARTGERVLPLRDDRSAAPLFPVAAGPDLLGYALPGEPLTWVSLRGAPVPRGLPTPVIDPTPFGWTWGVTAGVLWWACTDGLCRAPLDPGAAPLDPIPVSGTVMFVSRDWRWLLGLLPGSSQLTFVADAATGASHVLPEAPLFLFGEGGRVVQADSAGALRVFDAATGERVAVRDQAASADVMRVDGEAVLAWLPAPDTAPVADWIALAELLSAREVGPGGLRTLAPAERVARFEALRARHPEWLGPTP